MNAKAFRAHRELRIMFVAWETLCPPSEDTEVTDYFSVFSVLRGLFLFSTDDTEVTDEVFSVISVLCGLIFISRKLTEFGQVFTTIIQLSLPRYNDIINFS